MNTAQNQDINARLKELGIELPVPSSPAAAFVPFVTVNGVVHLAGHIAKKGAAPWVGKVGEGIALDEARSAARSVAIDLLATLQAACGDLNRVERFVKLMVFVNSAPGFVEQHLVANGSSELLVQVFQERGQHARSAIGVAQLPLGTCVEIEAIAKLY